ncbi:hypothetical protein AKJ16_DCAP17071 [Drosera capensis]
MPWSKTTSNHVGKQAMQLRTKWNNADNLQITTPKRKRKRRKEKVGPGVGPLWFWSKPSSLDGLRVNNRAAHTMPRYGPQKQYHLSPATATEATAPSPERNQQNTRSRCLAIKSSVSSPTFLGSSSSCW